MEPTRKLMVLFLLILVMLAIVSLIFTLYNLSHKKKKRVIIGLSAFIVFIIGTTIHFITFSNWLEYNHALLKLKEGSTDAALSAFTRSGGYRDAEEYISILDNIINNPNEMEAIELALQHASAGKELITHELLAEKLLQRVLASKDIDSAL